ncbi:Transmembrane protease serine 9 [Chamberlinius hualienensis]
MKTEAFNFLIFLICGINQISCRNNYKIIGGQNAVVGQFPWQVSLQYNNGTDNVHFCSGALIDRKWVLTAAHCLHGSAVGHQIKATGFEAVAGITNLDDSIGTEQRIQVESYIINADFDQSTLQGDIALLNLTAPFELKYAVEVISLPSLKQSSCCRANVSGWGASTPGGDTTNRLQWLEMDIISDADCQTMLAGHNLVEAMICTYQNGNGPCDGDSGGPVVALTSNSSAYYLVGVVSWGVLCGDPSYPSVHTEVSYYVDWISQNVK